MICVCVVGMYMICVCMWVLYVICVCVVGVCMICACEVLGVYDMKLHGWYDRCLSG